MLAFGSRLPSPRGRYIACLEKKDEEDEKEEEEEKRMRPWLDAIAERGTVFKANITHEKRSVRTHMCVHTRLYARYWIASIDLS